MGNTVYDIIEKMRTTPQGIRFTELAKICDFHFGAARQNKGSHRVYKMPWSGDPRINIQNYRGKAKPYQVKQVLLAIDKLIGDENG